MPPGLTRRPSLRPPRPRGFAAACGLDGAEPARALLPLGSLGGATGALPEPTLMWSVLPQESRKAHEPGRLLVWWGLGGRPLTFCGDPRRRLLRHRRYSLQSGPSQQAEPQRRAAGTGGDSSCRRRRLRARCGAPSARRRGPGAWPRRREPAAGPRVVYRFKPRAGVLHDRALPVDAHASPAPRSACPGGTDVSKTASLHRALAFRGQ